MDIRDIDRALADLQRRAMIAKARAEDKRNAIFSVCPAARDKFDEAAEENALGVLAKISGNRAGARQHAERAKELRLEAAELIKNCGYSEKDLEQEYSCPLCKDTGYVNGKLCECVKAAATRYRQAELSKLSPVPDCAFEQFSLDYYPTRPVKLANGRTVVPRKTMERIFAYCKEYAENFSKKAGSLIFIGGAGLGKTHLACSIGKVCGQNGFTVMYASSQSLFETAEKERYSRDRGLPNGIFDCDLLILDDLGAENLTSYSLSLLYNVINTRMLSKKPCIFTTNMRTHREAQRRYGEKISSRLFGNCEIFYFVGEDIRIQKKHP